MRNYVNCPFYGRHLQVTNTKDFPSAPPLLLLDSQGNQCALVTKAFAPCEMEVLNLPVDWAECPLVKEIRLETTP